MRTAARFMFVVILSLLLNARLPAQRKEFLEVGTLGQLIKKSPNIAAYTVVSVALAPRSITYKKSADLKGGPSPESLTHDLRSVDSIDWAYLEGVQTGDTAICFNAGAKSKICL